MEPDAASATVFLVAPAAVSAAQEEEAFVAAQANMAAIFRDMFRRG